MSTPDPVRCQAIIRPPGLQYHRRCSRNATTIIRGMALCTQHADAERKAG